MGREHTLDKLQRVFFEGAGESSLTSVQLTQLRRYRAAFSIWLDKPILSDSNIRDFLIKEHGVSKQQAYTDIHNLKYLLGNVTNAGKEWQRYKADQLISEAVSLLDPKEVEREVSVSKPKKKKKVVGFGMSDIVEEDKPDAEIKKIWVQPSKTDVLVAEAKIKAAKALVDIHKLKMDEAEQIPWDDIIPHDWEATDDPTVIGLKPIPNIREKIKKLKKKYGQDIEIVDTDYEDLSNEEEKEDIF